MPASNLKHFFAGSVEQTFQVSLGVTDPLLIDYVVDLLLRFVRWEGIGGPFTDAVDMLLQAEGRHGSVRRDALCRVGDVTLFWSGVYGEGLRRQQAGSQDFLLDYQQVGKRAYYMASTIPAADSKPRSDTLEQLSHDFELCCYGLDQVSRGWQ